MADKYEKKMCQKPGEICLKNRVAKNQYNRSCRALSRDHISVIRSRMVAMAGEEDRSKQYAYRQRSLVQPLGTRYGRHFKAFKVIVLIAVKRLFGVIFIKFRQQFWKKG